MNCENCNEKITWPAYYHENKGSYCRQKDRWECDDCHDRHKMEERALIISKLVAGG